MANELAIMAVNDNNIGMSYCSIKPTGNRADDARIFAALNNPTNNIADFINKRLSIVNVLVEVREILNEDTGEVEAAPRVVLIDEKGESYQAVSKGIFSAVQNAYTVFGEAPWNPPLQIEVKQKPVKRGSMLTFNVVG